VLYELDHCEQIMLGGAIYLLGPGQHLAAIGYYSLNPCEQEVSMQGATAWPITGHSSA
jgi:hypothetical protein